MKDWHRTHETYIIETSQMGQVRNGFLRACWRIFPSADRSLQRCRFQNTIVVLRVECRNPLSTAGPPLDGGSPLGTLDVNVPAELAAFQHLRDRFPMAFLTPS